MTGTASVAPIARRRTLKFKLASALIAAAFALVMAEVAIRASGYRPHFRYEEWNLRLDRDVLFSIQPKSGPEINNYGYRDRDFQTKAAGAYRILFMGDSFVMGHNVGFDQTLPKVLARKLGKPFDVLNMGIYGYGPDQELKRFEREGKSLQPDLVILSIFPGNDFGDVYKNELFTIDPKGNVIENETNPIDLELRRPMVWMLARSAFTGHFFSAESEQELSKRLFEDVIFHLRLQPREVFHKSISLMHGVLREYKSRVESSGAKFCVLIIPSYVSTIHGAWFDAQGLTFEDHFFNERAIVEMCKELKAPYLDLSKPLEQNTLKAYFDVRDAHLSASGIEFSIDLLIPFLRENKLIPAAGPSTGNGK